MAASQPPRLRSPVVSFLGYAVGFVVVDWLWFGRGKLWTGTPALYVFGFTFCAMLAAAEYAWACYRHRRDRPHGSCTACGYDRAGLAAEAVCPKCGASPI